MKPKFAFALREDLKDEKRFLPRRAHPNDTGWDVFAAPENKEPIVLNPFEYVKIPLGIRAFPEAGYWFELKPRSSTFVKRHLHALYGTIDVSYEGEIQMCVQYIPDNTLEGSKSIVINFGEAVGQIVPVKLQEMDIVEWTNEQYDINAEERGGKRGAGGFGSTGF